MKRRTTSLVTALAILGCAAWPAAASSYEKSALSGQEIYIFRNVSLNADCSSAGANDVRIIAGPSHGTVRLVHAKIYAGFAKSNDRWKCNAHKVDGIKGLYRSKPGYKGRDQVTFSVHTYMGDAHQAVVSINVE
ncbi:MULTISPECIES: hypothetical protein [unclassified Mesorhizobium]|uniref:hypothetical protein n=1 Tax=unclassified Mesorhizobium TaxID=325217 RepID=UPI001CD006BF|nr:MULTISPECIES: hypothetical protein [unclassified Mesorhizobium]MBZ9743553.1 hypothetical protein [Mesorhizobium sp. CO1-1-4]MBZ9804833.1 hypothetical protein [Mesorhizobium sp. ES1-6]